MKIVEFLSSVSDDELSEAYEEILEWRRTGLLPDPSCLQHLSSCADKEEPRDVENAVLMEIGRRFSSCVQIVRRYRHLQKGDPIWYVNETDGELETGVVDSVHLEQSIGVDFGDDYDEFSWDALGVSLFTSYGSAASALRKTKSTAKKVRCKNSFLCYIYDDNGYLSGTRMIPTGAVFEIDGDPYRFVGGPDTIRLVNEHDWIEILPETFDRYFEMEEQ